MIRLLGILDDLPIFRVCQTLAVLGYALILLLCVEQQRQGISTGLASSVSSSSLRTATLTPLVCLFAAGGRAGTVMCGGRPFCPGCVLVWSLGVLLFAVRCLFAASAADCRATCALFRALCESVLLSCSESVLLSCSNSPSWPSRSRCLVSVVTHVCVRVCHNRGTLVRQSYARARVCACCGACSLFGRRASL